MKLVRRTLMAILVVAMALCVHPLRAKPEAAVAENRLQQVALFKNGLGFFVSEVDIPKNERAFSIVPSGAASHGTFWVSYPARVKLEGLVARMVDSERMMDAVTIPELLRANVGRKLRLTYHGREVDCVIKYFPQDRAPVPMGPYAVGRADSVRSRHGRSQFMLLQGEDDQLAINPQSVTQVEFLSDEAKTSFSSVIKSAQLDVRLAKPAGGQKLTLSYLAKGITWAPSYMVDISEPDKARISAKAAIINDIGDLDNVRVQLVTGSPNLQFADIVSPLALKQNLAQFLQALASGQSHRGRMAGVMSQRAAVMYNELDSSASIMPDYGAADTGQMAEDLFFYPVEKVNLKKDQVGYYPLFTESVAYEHIYQWDIPDYVNEDGRYTYGQRDQGQGPVEQDIWHSLRLQNTTKVPWTTAPAQTVKDGLILGQDTLKYTPSKGKNTLRITKAMSVKAQQKELETERQRGVLTVYGRNYDLVDIEGKLSVRNFQDKAITMEITKTVSGEVVSHEPRAKIEKLARGLRAVNSLSKLTWSIELEPGQEKEINYAYRVYVRR